MSAPPSRPASARRPRGAPAGTPDSGRAGSVPSHRGPSGSPARAVDDRHHRDDPKARVHEEGAIAEEELGRTASAPATARSTNPEGTVSTATSTTCLSQTEYSASRTT